MDRGAESKSKGEKESERERQTERAKGREGTDRWPRTTQSASAISPGKG